MNNLVVILGPTGVGKTQCCIDIARHLHAPVINADSRQIFAEIPIGTAAPTPEQRQEVTHYFVGNHHLTDYYSASMFEQDVLQLLNALFHDKEHPIQTAIMSGGSMLYIDAVCNGIDDIPTVRDDIRREMKQRLATEGLPALVEELHKLDPDHWAIVDRNNPRRVVHALEICHQTGKTYSSFRTNTHRQRPFHIIKIGLNRPREEMYERINQRVLKMMENGLEEEARKVYPLRHLNALNTVGYKELFNYFDGAIPKEEAIRQIQSNTRRYMRKQITWFKKDESIAWFHPDNIEDILKYIDKELR
ncbi:MAG: tRNA (adenosine(37)-N6)-dimethylallyltransferase MiaA [Prevotella sp.]|jgi:tRNA dimethylallyltransferase